MNRFFLIIGGEEGNRKREWTDPKSEKRKEPWKCDRTDRLGHRERDPVELASLEIDPVSAVKGTYPDRFVLPQNEKTDIRADPLLRNLVSCFYIILEFKF